MFCTDPNCSRNLRSECCELDVCCVIRGVILCLCLCLLLLCCLCLFFFFVCFFLFFYSFYCSLKRIGAIINYDRAISSKMLFCTFIRVGKFLDARCLNQRLYNSSSGVMLNGHQHGVSEANLASDRSVDQKSASHHTYIRALYVRHQQIPSSIQDTLSPCKTQN